MHSTTSAVPASTFLCTAKLVMKNYTHMTVNLEKKKT